MEKALAFDYGSRDPMPLKPSCLRDWLAGSAERLEMVDRTELVLLMGCVCKCSTSEERVIEKLGVSVLEDGTKCP